MDITRLLLVRLNVQATTMTNAQHQELVDGQRLYPLELSAGYCIRETSRVRHLRISAYPAPSRERQKKSRGTSHSLHALSSHRVMSWKESSSARRRHLPAPQHISEVIGLTPVA